MPQWSQGGHSVLQASVAPPKASVLVPVGLLLVWALVSGLGLVSPLLLPSPVRVLGAIVDIGPEQLARHIAVTFMRIVVGFAIGAACGFAVGVVMQRSRIAFTVLDPIVQPSRAVPPVALLPFFILIFGFAEAGRIVLIVLGTSLIVCVGTIEAINRVPASIVKLGLVMGLPRGSLYRRVIIPASLPELRGTLRIALALAVSLVVVAEFLGVQSGLGYLINLSRVTLSTHTIVLAVILITTLSWSLDRLIVVVFRRVFDWDRRSDREV